MTKPLTRLSEIRARGWKIFTEAELESASPVWMRALVATAKPFSEVQAGRFETIGAISDSERFFAQKYLKKADKVTDEGRRRAIYQHAVRLHRLDKLLRDIERGTVATPPAEDEPAKAVAPKTARPKRKPGRKSEDPPKRIEAIQAVINEQKRRGLEPNVQGAVIEIIDAVDWDKVDDPSARDKALARLIKRKWSL